MGSLINRRRWMAGAGAVSGGVILTACAPRTLSPLVPEASFGGPRIEDQAFIVQDGARLPFLRWGPAQSDQVLIALHGINDHKMSFHMAGPWWAEQGLITYAYDQRGFGEATGRGIWPGQGLMKADLRTVVDLVRQAQPNAKITLVGESMGGAVVITALADNVPAKADAAVLLAPAVWGWSSQTFLNRMSLRAAARLTGAMAADAPDFVRRQIRASDNIDELMRMARDPAMIGRTRMDVVYGLVDLMEAASQDLGLMTVPTLLMYGGHDMLVDVEPMRRALLRADGAPLLSTAYYPDGWHLLNRDLQAENVWRDVAVWVRNPHAPLATAAPPVLPAIQHRGSNRPAWMR